MKAAQSAVSRQHHFLAHLASPSCSRFGFPKSAARFQKCTASGQAAEVADSKAGRWCRSRKEKAARLVGESLRTSLEDYCLPKCYCCFRLYRKDSLLKR